MSPLAVPKSWYLPSKPHKFCPGCGHGIILKALGVVVAWIVVARRAVTCPPRVRRAGTGLRSGGLLE